MASPQEKGDELEAAVHAIESAILTQSPIYRDKDFVIKSKQVVVVEGVKHEIDILVQVKIAPGYEALFIFECKNWKKAVSKNEIVSFSDKISDLNAQKGFFVATGFSRSAHAKAKQDPRMVLLVAKAEDPENTPVPLHFHVIRTESVKSEALLVAEPSTLKPGRFDLSSVETTLDGQRINLGANVKEWESEIVDSCLKSFPSALQSDGIYHLEAADSRTFAEGQLIVEGATIKSIELSCELEVRVAHPAVVSHYDVETRGRFIKAERRLDDGGWIEAVFAEPAGASTEDDS